MSIEPEFAPWPVSPKPVTLDEALLRWDAAKNALSAAKETEMEARKLAFSLGFGDAAKEGTNTRELGNGYELMGVKKLNYKLKAPGGFKGDIIEAVDLTATAFACISNEGAFVAERLFKYSVDMSISEYRKLVEEADYSESKRAMLVELNKILEITDAAPTLEIKAPKTTKG